MSNFPSPPTFLFYDYETFGISPSLDRPVQFAAIRSDIDLKIISKPKIFYCKPSDDYLPQPTAVILTGITPQEAHKKGTNEANFARRIHNLFTIPNTCIMGYNNIRFDDEVTRNIFYRNFYDPYEWSWKNGNSRLDLLNVMQACYALRPEGIVWPKDDAGLPTFSLGCLTRANGIEHGNAHNAIADVYATISIARLAKTAQPRLFDYLLNYRRKQKLMTLIDVKEMNPLVHVSSIFGAWRGNTSWIVPLGWHPNNQNVLIVVDLASDIRLLLEADSNDLRAQLNTFKKTLDKNTKVIPPLKLIHINKCPVLAQANMLRPSDAERLGINRKNCLKNLKILQNNPNIQSKILAIFSEETADHFVLSDNVDEQLYNGFFTSDDRVVIKTILKTEPHKLSTLDISYTEKRIEKLMFNYRARNYPETLNEIEQKQWLRKRRAIFTSEFLQSYFQKLNILFLQYEGDREKQKKLQDLWRYAQEIL